MRRISPLFFAAFFLVACFAGCHPGYRPSNLQYVSYDVNQQETDTAYLRFIKPYADKVGETMNNPVGELPQQLVKSLPDGSLGNFMADAYLAMARQKYDPATEIAYMNHGGIRLNQIQSGVLRRGTVYEVMPFDNLMVIIKVKGSLLKQFLDHIAEEGGGGIAGLQMTIREKKAVNILIQGQPFDPERTYTMANSDYVVNGGGRFTAFRGQPAQNTGYLLRDAILDYCAGYQSAGKPIPVSTDKRIVHE